MGSMVPMVDRGLKITAREYHYFAFLYYKTTIDTIGTIDVIDLYRFTYNGSQ